jgi:hypothetical protein
VTLFLLLACPRTSEPRPVTDPPPITLGWKWVPGDTLQMELSSQATSEDQTVTRVEVWEYLMREVDHHGVATLEGQLMGLGAEVLRDGDRLTDRETRAARDYETGLVGPVELRIAMDGRLVSIEGVGWSEGLPHRLLAQQLSTEPVELGARWPDPVVARPYADLIPVDLELTVEGYETLEGLYQVGGEVLALVETRGAVKPHEPGAPEIWLNGESWWDPARGRMTSRELRVVLANADGPGELTLRAREIR